MNFHRSFTSSDDCWYLPALTSLHLRQLTAGAQTDLPESCFSCLPALTNLRLEGFDLPNYSMSLRGLTMLLLKACIVSQLMWDLPALISLELDDVDIGTCITEFLSTLANLQSLKILSHFEHLKDCLICSCQLLYLELRMTNRGGNICIPNILILAPKLLNVNIVGVFSIICSDSKLENVYVSLDGCFEDKNSISWGMLKQFYRHLMFMFRGLNSAKILALDSNTIEALSAVVYDLECSSSPFHNLKCVKLPQGYKESRICGTVKSYLLGGSPGATIVTTLGQNDVISRITPGPPAPQNVMQEEPSVTPTIELVNSRNVHKKMCTSGVVDGKLGQVGALVPVAPETCDYWASSSKESNVLGLWQGHEVNSEFVSLLDLIMKKYPQTFEQFTTNNKKLCTMKLNMLCTLIKTFTTINMTEINTEMITEFRTLFSDLQTSFNVKWLVSHLNYIEQFLFSQHEPHSINSCIGDAKSKLQVLTKTIKVEEDFRTTGTNLDASIGDIGDDLLQVLTTVGSKKTTNDEEVGTNIDSSVGYNGEDVLSDP